MITISKTIKKAACAVLTAALVVTSVALPKKVEAAADVVTNISIRGGNEIPKGQARNIDGTISVNNGVKFKTIEFRAVRRSNGSTAMSVVYAPGANVRVVNVVNTKLNTDFKFGQLSAGDYYLEAIVNYVRNGRSYSFVTRISFKIYIPAPVVNNDYTGFVTHIYLNALGRQPDQQGLNSWVNALNSGASGADVIRGFIHSQEFINRNLSNESYVNVLYATLLGRAPDAPGYNHWLGALQNGVSRDNVLEGCLGSQEFSDYCSRFNVRAH